MGSQTKKVIVYSTPTCSFCAMAKKYLNEKGVSFEDVDVSRDRTRAMEMVQKSGQMGVPVISIDGEIVLGYQPVAYDALLNR